MDQNLRESGFQLRSQGVSVANRGSRERDRRIVISVNVTTVNVLVYVTVIAVTQRRSSSTNSRRSAVDAGKLCDVLSRRCGRSEMRR